MGRRKHPALVRQHFLLCQMPKTEASLLSSQSSWESIYFWSQEWMSWEKGWGSSKNMCLVSDEKPPKIICSAWGAKRKHSCLQHRHWRKEGASTAAWGQGREPTQDPFLFVDIVFVNVCGRNGSPGMPLCGTFVSKYSCHPTRPAGKAQETWTLGS